VSEGLDFGACRAAGKDPSAGALFGCPLGLAAGGGAVPQGDEDLQKSGERGGGVSEGWHDSVLSECGSVGCSMPPTPLFVSRTSGVFMAPERTTGGPRALPENEFSSRGRGERGAGVR